MHNLTEFTVISKYFQPLCQQHSLLSTGIGDDAAVIAKDEQLDYCLSTDSFIEGVHFPANISAADLAYRSLAISLSDLAAMGAKAEFASLALTIPEVTDQWLSDFASGIKQLLQQFAPLNLIGGDTTRGKLSLSWQVIGSVAKNKAVLRSGAKPGDSIYISGNLGDAYLGLQACQGIDLEKLDKTVVHSFLRPKPQLKLGASLIGIASSMIDISDGLLQDLQHILTASNYGAKIYLDKIPTSNIYKKYFAKLDKIAQLEKALTHGDDYQLLFTVANDKIKKLPDKIIKIGEITIEKQINKLWQDEPIMLHYAKAGYQHF